MKNPTAPVSIGLGFALALGLLVTSIVALPTDSANSREPNKTLKLHFGHTGEKGEFTFKRNGRYDRGELKRINHFLRDWRRNEDAKMDPQLLDLIWAIYQKSGSRDYIHVVSAYRSPATNEQLRKRSSGVAKNSQHRLGKAMDWYVTDVPLAKLRATAMKLQGGGVGYYPRSGSPFVHTDTGSVRAWPRMTRQQLVALFPNGNTLHLPSDGKPLPGYEQALAKRKASGSTALAYLDTGAGEEDETDRTGTGTATADTSSNGWLKRVFPGRNRKQDVEVAAETPAAPDQAPTPAPVPAAAETEVAAVAPADEDMPRAPRSRPGSAMEAWVTENGGEVVVASVDAQAVESLEAAPLPRMRPQLEASETAAVSGQDAIASLTERMNQESRVPTEPPADPIELAFAAASGAPEPSEAERAILTAFATLTDSDAVKTADPALTAAITRLAAAEEPKPLPKLALTYASSALVPTAQAAPAPAAAETVTEVVTTPVELAYGGDEPALVSLIDTPKTPSLTVGEFAMPSPASEFYKAPEAASDVADLRGHSGPPTAHFETSTETADEQGFLTRLFASLIE